MHTVLYLEPNWPVTHHDKPLEQTPVESGLCCLSADDYWTELQVISNKDNLLSRFEHGQYSFWLNGLRSLIDEHAVEDEIFDASICTRDASTTDDVGVGEDIHLSLLLLLVKLVFFL